MHTGGLIANLRFQDILDILFLTAVVYHLYLWFWGTKAFKALVGLLALGIIFTAAQAWGLFLTTWVFQILWQVLVVLLIILFQSEIRQVLERVNPLNMIGMGTSSGKTGWGPPLAETVFALAAKKIGALIILQRGETLEELLTGGMALDAEPRPELIISLFQKASPLHDGALVIHKDKISRVATYLPLSSSEALPNDWGTRHRAAMGLSERCDAWVLVVSEERGEVSLARGGDIVPVKTAERLSQFLQEAFDPPDPPQRGWWPRIGSLATHRWRLKLGSLVLVGVSWLLLAGQQDFEVNLLVPLEVKNLPSDLELLDPVKPRVRIRVRGLRKDASTLSDRNVHAQIDLSFARLGNRIFRVTRDQITLPNDRVYVVEITPPQVAFELREKPR